MTVRRLAGIPGFSIDRVAAAAGDDPAVLRLENLDTDIPPPAAAVRRTAEVAGDDDANSWLPFTGRHRCAGRWRPTSNGAAAWPTTPRPRSPSPAVRATPCSTPCCAPPIRGTGPSSPTRRTP